MWHREVVGQIIDGGVYAEQAANLFVPHGEMTSTTTPESCSMGAVTSTSTSGAVLPKIDGRARSSDVKDAILALAGQKARPAAS